jgi:hypothetical protein
MLADEQLPLLNNLSSTHMAGALLLGAAIEQTKALSRYERELNFQMLPFFFSDGNERRAKNSLSFFGFQFF